MDSRACACVKSELDLFNVNPVQLSTEDSSFTEIFPIASLSDKTPIEFYVSGSGEHYLDLAHTLLHLQVKVKKKNGTILGAPDQVAPINYLLNTLFSECSITLNDKQVSSQANYAYRCIFYALLSPRAVQESMLTSGLFYKDSASKHESVELANASDNINPGYQTIYSICKESKLIDMIGPLHFDLGNQSKCLINSVNFRIKLEKNKDSFALMSATQDFKIVIVHASLFVRKVKVAPSVMITHEVPLSKGFIKIPIRRTEVKSFALSSGMQSLIIPNAFIGQLPTRLIIDGNRMIPSKPLQPKFDHRNSYSRCYMSLFTDVGQYHTDQDINISYREYKEGYTLVATDLTPDLSADGMHESILRMIFEMDSITLCRLACSDFILRSKFGGVYASDELPKTINNYSCFIINLDPKAKPGSH
ncbi:uncharacterized protein F54H12.2 [Trichonephila clavata]|uniref:Uncharacterized protein F54H12.2 n=1 Tax=Trichonephila clavata TaxID=2740835 RepID=A0A8X6F4G4_TRICU|nr:uncharacterized protein F54H12.2 [Trichonephila clavata]